MALIPWWIRYPNVNDEIMNLDWLLRVSNENTEKISNFINLNTIKYADPILWDITSQYEANTITVDPQTGDAYISTKAVPYGVSLSNTDYWTKIYNYADEINKLEEQIAAANERLSTTASDPRDIGDLVWLNGLLYEVTAPMIAGDSYVVGSNCKKITIEELLDESSEAVEDEAEARAEADAALGERITSEAEARSEADTALGERITSEAEARSEADAALQEAINNMASVNGSNITDFDIAMVPNLTLELNEALQGCTYLDGYFYIGVMVGAEVSQKIHKVSASDGSVILTQTYTNLQHINSLCTDGTYLYCVTNDGNVYKINPTNLTIIETIAISVSVFAMCKYTNGFIGIHYLSNPWRPELVFYDNSFTLVKTQIIEYPTVNDNTESINSLVIQGISCDDKFIYIGKSDTNGVLTFSMSGIYIGSSYTAAGFTKTDSTIYFENEDLDVTADGNLYIYTYNANSRSIVIVKTNVFNYHDDRGTYNIIYRGSDHRVVITNKCYTLGAILYYYHAGYTVFLNYAGVIYNTYVDFTLKNVTVFNTSNGASRSALKLNMNSYVTFTNCVIEGLGIDSTNYFVMIYNSTIFTQGIQYISNNNTPNPRVYNSTIYWYSNNYACKINAYGGVLISIGGYGQTDMPPSYFINTGGAVFQYPTEMILYHS